MNEPNDANEPVVLPEPPSAAQADRMEEVVMTSVRNDVARSRARRARLWGGAAAAVAVVALAAFISPAVLSGISGGAASSADQSAVAPAGEPFPVTEFPMTEGGAESAPVTDAVAPESVTGAAGDAAVRTEMPGDREVVTTGWIQLTVPDVADATQQVSELAGAEGGYVESASIGGGGVQPIDGSSAPASVDGWITVRVPTDRLDAVIAAVSELGEVTSSSVDRTDVTDQAVDLRARIAAEEASVARLTELMAQAGSVGDLIAAETALSDRQASLDANRQQLALLENQVAMSSISVALTSTPAPTNADPAGFADGLVAGWNGLVATLNGTVVALGFLLPWLVVAAVVVVVVWGVRRLVRRRRARRASSSGEATGTPVASSEETDRR